MSRNEILNAVKANQPTFSALPESIPPDSDLSDITDGFRQMAKAAGAECVELQSVEEMRKRIETLKTALNIRSVYSELSKFGIDTVGCGRIVSAHDAKDIDLAVIEGGIAVAENGAVWVSDENIEYRACWFLAEHLAVLVDRRNIVGNMQEAYRRVELKRPGFGCFLAGPSKTADIEQSLVIGAHGPRSMTVFLV